MKNVAIIFILLLNANYSISQSNKWEAKLNPVAESGFYNIVLTPEITSHLNSNFSDLRLYSTSGEEIGYIIRSEQPVFNQQFKEYQIVENKAVKNCCTNLILKNVNRNKINNINLEIRNSNVRKTARLTGSDDSHNWYSIYEDYELISIYDTEKVSKNVVLHFPTSNYEYYKLEISDTASSPLQILRAGYYDNHMEEAKYQELPPVKINQKDSINKKSYLNFSFPHSQYLDKLTLYFHGHLPYFREARLCTLNTTGKKPYHEVIEQVSIKSGQLTTIHLQGNYSKDYCLIIDNKDNTPLRADSIKGFQLIKYVTANLDKNQDYILKFGNREALAPQYDLEYFRDSLSNISRTVYPNEVKSIIAANAIKDSKTTSTWWIWASIVGIGGLLALMSYRMIKDMKKQA